MKRERVSVLMSLYWREKPEWLHESLVSVFGQTRPADEVVMVVDGPVGAELEAELATWPDLRLVRLPENGGLGRALNAGLEVCTGSLIARMDTDDVCLPERIERQAAFMESHPEVAAMSATIEEFEGSVDNVVSRRSLPEQHDEIMRFARGRCPLNHPVVMFRREAVMNVGGYQHFKLFEDYYLWARLLAGGYRMHNLQEPLLRFRTSGDMWRRRGGWDYAKCCVRFQLKLRRMGLVGTAATIRLCAVRVAVCLMPNGLRRMLYAKFLRG